jgi:putative sterol carrier protein
MGLRLGTQDLADECMRRQDEDPAFQEKFKGLSIRLLFVGTDCPGDEDRQLALDIENGHFNEIIVSAKPAPSDLRTAPFDHTKYEFRVVAPQQTLVDMINGKMDMLQALEKVKIEGDIGKLMAQFAGFVGFLEVLGTMSIEP